MRRRAKQAADGAKPCADGRARATPSAQTCRPAHGPQSAGDGVGSMSRLGHANAYGLGRVGLGSAWKALVFGLGVALLSESTQPAEKLVNDAAEFASHD